MSTPTLQQIIDAVGGKPSRDGRSVVVGYGADGYLRLYPSSVTLGGPEIIPAVRIDGELSRGNGGAQSVLRAKIRAAGMEIR